MKTPFSLSQENHRLERECASVVDQLSDLRNQAQQQQEQLEHLSGLREQIIMQQQQVSSGGGAGVVSSGGGGMEELEQQVGE